MCGCGANIILNSSHAFHFYWSGGYGTNMRAKILALWGVMHCASWLVVDEILIVGDSKIVIDWAMGHHSLTVPSLIRWLEQISSLKAYFSSIYFCHIFREKNALTYQLSKCGAFILPGKICFGYLVNGSIITSGAFLF